MSAVGAQTRGLLLSGLAAGVTATVASFPAYLILPFAAKFLVTLLRPGPGATAVLEIVLGFVVPVAGAWLGLRALHAVRPFGVAHPENALVGLVWGCFFGVMTLDSTPLGWWTVLIFPPLTATLTALVPVRFVLPGLFFSPFTLFFVHSLAKAFGVLE